MYPCWRCCWRDVINIANSAFHHFVPSQPTCHILFTYFWQDAIVGWNVCSGKRWLCRFDKMLQVLTSPAYHLWSLALAGCLSSSGIDGLLCLLCFFLQLLNYTYFVLLLSFKPATLSFLMNIFFLLCLDLHGADILVACHYDALVVIHKWLFSRPLRASYMNL
jgi:hypothetical protein